MIISIIKIFGFSLFTICCVYVMQIAIDFSVLPGLASQALGAVSMVLDIWLWVEVADFTFDVKNKIRNLRNGV